MHISDIYDRGACNPFPQIMRIDLTLTLWPTDLNIDTVPTKIEAS